MNLIDKDAAITALSESYKAEKELFEKYHNVVRGGVVQGIVQATQTIREQPTLPDVNRAAILRLCNEIEDEVNDIAFNSCSQYTYDCCESIRDKLKQIGKELTGDDGTD